MHGVDSNRFSFLIYKNIIIGCLIGIDLIFHVGCFFIIETKKQFSMLAIPLLFYIIIFFYIYNWYNNLYDDFLGDYENEITGIKKGFFK
jgi:ACR3 family arsenite efflux pump ArsB